MNDVLIYPFFSPQPLLNWINPAYLFTSKIAQVTQVTNKFKGTHFEWFEVNLAALVLPRKVLDFHDDDDFTDRVISV